MKTAIIVISRISKELTGEYLRDLTALFESSQINLDSLDIISPKDDIGFLRKLERYIDCSDNLLIFSGDDAEFSVNQIICDKFDTVLLENDNAKSFLDAVSKTDGKEYSDDYALLPIDATVVPNLKGAMQGYILDSDNLTLSYLPNKFEQALPMCKNFVLPYLEKKSGKTSQKLTLKYFGDINLLYNTLDKAKELNGEWFFDVKEKFNDITIYLTFSDLVSDLERAEIVRLIVSSLKENIYSEFDTTLSERVFDLLKLRKVKLSVAESFTSGRVVADIIKNSGASSYVDEGVVTYSNESKIARLGVKEGDLNRVGAVSSMVAYQMASGLLKGGRCDIAISTTGIAGPKSDDTLKPVGLCYIGIGTKKEIHTYKFNFTGSREEITEKAKNTALFLAIKTLKNI